MTANATADCTFELEVLTHFALSNMTASVTADCTPILSVEANHSHDGHHRQNDGGLHRTGASSKVKVWIDLTANVTADCTVKDSCIRRKLERDDR